MAKTIDWFTGKDISEDPDVAAALQAFSENASQDDAIGLVQEIYACIKRLEDAGEL